MAAEALDCLLNLPEAVDIPPEDMKNYFPKVKDKVMSPHGLCTSLFDSH